ncbi:MAG: sulfate reduction electron transfer complex DsrMKJOP subunit DsrM [Raoultibacter sp.]
MKVVVPLMLTAVLAIVAWVGTHYLGLYTLFGVIVPYAAFVCFLVGFVFRLIKWGRSAVPFCIPTTCGQQKTLPWIKQNKIDNPSSFAGVVKRMLLEVLVFRSLFRNAKTEKREEQLGIGSAKWLWLGALVFHWSMLIVVIRHLRLFLEPVPAPLVGIDVIDAFFQIGLPLLYLTDVFLVCALTFLFLRRVVVPRMRYVSLLNDYFPLILLIGIAAAGILMRYVFRVDMVGVKEMTMGLVTLHPIVSPDIGAIFYIHLFLVCVLLAYFPWSKLMHAGGIFLSPTRNMANNSRMQRHVNPWDYKVKVHTYAEYEEEFKDKMVKVGLPLDAE